MIEFEKPPFVPTKLESERVGEQPFTVRLNEEERKVLDECKKIIEQEKDSTALKTLAWIGANVIHDQNTSYILGTIFKNKRNNKRLGIIEFEN